MPAPKLDATLFIREHGWDRNRMAIAMQVQAAQVSKYLGGHRRVSPGMKTALVKEFGEAAYVLVEMCDRAFAITHAAPSTPERGKRKPDRPIKNRPPEYAYAGDEHDGKTYPIDEWKRLFGEPGGAGADVNGRYSGYFDTEPCFIGE